MTTQREIRALVQPVIERHPDMVQVRRMLIVRPVHHVLAMLHFLGGSDRHNPNPWWFLCVLSMPPGLNHSFGRDIPIGYTNWPNFQRYFDERVYSSITNYLLPFATIEEFYRLAHHRSAFAVGPINHFPSQHAVILAALGRFDEAAEMLVAPLDQLERRAAAWIESGRTLLAKRANSTTGKQSIRFGEHDLRLAVQLRRLQTCLERRDAPSVTALLHEWEAAQVREWGVEAHWQPTPFPFEA